MFRRGETFLITNEHLALIKNTWLGWREVNAGGACVNTLRPYGNSAYIQDIADILGWDYSLELGFTPEQIERATLLHRQTQTALQISMALQCFQEGLYRKTQDSDDRAWKKVV